jgi:hypothetical protein
MTETETKLLFPHMLAYIKRGCTALTRSILCVLSMLIHARERIENLLFCTCVFLYLFALIYNVRKRNAKYFALFALLPFPKR